MFTLNAVIKSSSATTDLWILYHAAVYFWWTATSHLLPDHSDVHTHTQKQHIVSQLQLLEGPSAPGDGVRGRVPWRKDFGQQWESSFWVRPDSWYVLLHLDKNDFLFKSSCDRLLLIINLRLCTLMYTIVHLLLKEFKFYLSMSHITSWSRGQSLILGPKLESRFFRAKFGVGVRQKIKASASLISTVSVYECLRCDKSTQSCTIDCIFTK